MQVCIPFLKTHLPELASLPEPQRREILARCADHPSMHALAKRHMTLMRVGWAILPIGVIIYFVLSRGNVDPWIVTFTLVGTMAAAVAWMVGSLLRYHRRSSRQLRSLIQAAVEVEDTLTDAEDRVMDKAR